MTATTLATERYPLLDTSTGDLVLRISGSSRNGQIVRLKSAKCTIGSGPHCTLRLVAHGVAPLHCLLLRGPAATVARCWWSDTRLNDKFFSDAILSCGDRLSIGPIELEVLDVGATLPARQPEIEHEEIQRGADRQREQFAARLAELEAAHNALATERDELGTQRNALAEDRRQWQAQQEETQREIEEQRERLAVKSSELESQRKALATERDDAEAKGNAQAEQRLQWRAEQEETQRGIDEQREQLAARAAELESQRNALAAERHALEAQRNALAEHRQQWHVQYEENQRGINEQREQLAAHLTELESQWNALRDESQQWQAKHREAQRGIDEQHERLAAQLAELESQRAAMVTERGGLDAQWNALAEERRQWQAQQKTPQSANKRQEQVNTQLAELESQRTALAAERDSLETQRKALAEERRLWELQRVELPEQERPVVPTGPSPTPSAQEPPAPATPKPAATPELHFEEAAEQPLVDLNDVFRRTGAKADLPEEDRTPPTPIPMTQPRSARNVPRPAAAEHAPPQATAESAAKEDEEESIDDYMSRLMQRVRPSTSESEGPPRTTHRPEPIRAGREAPARAVAVEPSQPDGSTTPPPSEPEAVQPRPRTPPKHIDLSAFRELANMSARHAIQQHSRRALVRAMYSKLTVMFVALLAGVGMLWMWKQFGACKLTFYSSLAAIIVALFWGLEYALLSGRLVVGKSGHVNVGRKGSSNRGASVASSAGDDDAESSAGEDAGSPAEPS